MKIQGFSLIEIVIALLIGSMLSLVLYTALRQTQRTVTQVNGLIDSTAELLPLYAQLELDLMALSSPEKLKLTAQGDRFSTLSFITTHSMGSPFAHLTEVTYRLTEDPTQEKKFILSRVEKSGRPYTLLRDIQELRVFYTPHEKDRSKKKVRVQQWPQSGGAEKKETLPACISFEGVVGKDVALHYEINMRGCNAQKTEKAQEPTGQAPPAPQGSLSIGVVKI